MCAASPTGSAAPAPKGSGNNTSKGVSIGSTEYHQVEPLGAERPNLFKLKPKTRKGKLRRPPRTRVDEEQINCLARSAAHVFMLTSTQSGDDTVIGGYPHEWPYLFRGNELYIFAPTADGQPQRIQLAEAPIASNIPALQETPKLPNKVMGWIGRVGTSALKQVKQGLDTLSGGGDTSVAAPGAPSARGRSKQRSKQHSHRERSQSPQIDSCAWIIDSGCAQDLVDEDTIRRADLEDQIQPSDDILVLNTANGSRRVDSEIQLSIAELHGEEVRPKVLPRTPLVLSLGRRCIDDGYRFEWEPYSQKPILTTPRGRRVTMTVDKYIPYLITGDPSEGFRDGDAAPGEEDTSPKLLSLVSRFRRKQARKESSPEARKEPESKPGGAEAPPTSAKPGGAVSPPTSAPVEAPVTGGSTSSSLGRAGAQPKSALKKNTPTLTSREEKALSEALQDAQRAKRKAEGRDEDDSSSSSSSSSEEPEGEVKDAAEAIDPSKVRRNLKEEAISLQHLMTHMPKNPWCSTCMRGKMQRKMHRRKTKVVSKEKFTKWGQCLTADHIITRNKRSLSFMGHKAAIGMLDLGCNWKELWAVPGKDSVHARHVLINVQGSGPKIKRFYSDSSPELIQAAQELGIPHDQGTPGIKPRNGVGERVGRDLLEGARCILIHAGLPHKLWPLAGRYIAFSKNITITDGDSPWNKRHKKGNWDGPLHPFGCLVDYLPIPDQRDALNLGVKGKFETRSQRGIFLGYFLQPGGKWDGEYLVADLDCFVNLNFITCVGPKGSRAIKTQRVLDVWRDQTKPIEFPLKAEYDKAFRTLEGRREQLKGAVDAGLVDKSLKETEEAIDSEALAQMVDQSVTDLSLQMGEKQGENTLVPRAELDPAPGPQPEASSSSTAPVPPPPPQPAEGEEGFTPRKFMQHGTVQGGRPTRTYTKKDGSAGKRPPNIWVEEWTRMSVKQREAAEAAWKATLPTEPIPPPPDAAASVVHAYTVKRNGWEEGVHKMEEILYEAPHLPVLLGSARNTPELHREKTPWPLFNAAVARAVKPSEVKTNERAQDAMASEWARLRKIGTWDESRVREYRDVMREARDEDRTIHMGKAAGICVEKNHELPPEDPLRKYKGRVVFLGDQVKTQNYEAAIFQDLGSCPASLEANKAADLYGLSPGHAIQGADATQAYTQAKLGGTETWIELPSEAWSDSNDPVYAKWQKAGMQRPVCPLILALYGHPDSGGFWEKHCDTKLRSVGFTSVGDEWDSCYWHAELELYLVVYVDDFKLSGPQANLEKGWKLIREGDHG